jgi:hypothetical protein
VTIFGSTLLVCPHAQRRSADKASLFLDGGNFGGLDIALIISVGKSAAYDRSGQL